MFACKASEDEHTARILVPGRQDSFPPHLISWSHHVSSHIELTLYAELLTEGFCEIHLSRLQKRVIYEDDIQ